MARSQGAGVNGEGPHGKGPGRPGRCSSAPARTHWAFIQKTMLAEMELCGRCHPAGRVGCSDIKRVPRTEEEPEKTWTRILDNGRSMTS